MTHVFKPGDTVRHLPSGETWTIAASDQDYVCPAGWPETQALQKDCELIKSSSAVEFMEMVLKTQKLPVDDIRYRINKAWLDGLRDIEL